jgi:hypothetical protein
MHPRLALFLAFLLAALATGAITRCARKGAPGTQQMRT